MGGGHGRAAADGVQRAWSTLLFAPLYLGKRAGLRTVVTALGCRQQPLHLVL